MMGKCPVWLVFRDVTYFNEIKNSTLTLVIKLVFIRSDTVQNIWET